MAFRFGLSLAQAVSGHRLAPDDKTSKVIIQLASGVGRSWILASRVLSIDPLGGTGLELDSIAAVVIGGASLSGGRGSIIGTLFGVFIMVFIRNGLNLLGVSPYWQGTAIGSIIIAAVLLERSLNRRSRD